MEVGQRVIARAVVKNGHDWGMSVEEGVIERDFLLAYASDGYTQNLWGVRLDNGTLSNYWTNQLEIVV